MVALEVMQETIVMETGMRTKKRTMNMTVGKYTLQEEGKSPNHF